MGGGIGVWARDGTRGLGRKRVDLGGPRRGGVAGRVGRVQSSPKRQAGKKAIARRLEKSGLKPYLKTFEIEAPNALLRTFRSCISRRKLVDVTTKLFASPNQGKVDPERSVHEKPIYELISLVLRIRVL
ncbi:hypothetical protein NL676_034601 [Syzygium grande]|nr:hypothetical protein NL676_034601 [Syzygium grande]